MKNLFSPYSLGSAELPNRTVMAPMTRNRADEHGVPTALMADYYRQRASAGLLVTEASQVSPRGVGYPHTPGIHDSEQVGAWRAITEAVHEAGGRVFLQLFHAGRISHSLLQHDGSLPVGPSPIAAAGEHHTPEGPKPFETPRALETGEVQAIVDEFRQGAANAREAGFDGVEIHAANGYLPDQFLRDGTNQRRDKYGGTVAGRARFLLEISEAVSDAWSGDRVGVRLSPSGTFNDMRDSDPAATFSYVVRELDRIGVEYVHLVEGGEADLRHGGTLVPSAVFRPLFSRTLIVNGGYDGDRAERVIAAGEADLVSFGVLFLANPDLPARLEANGPFNEPDPATFYGGGAQGYTDYSTLG
jgi:N-ethylmaleimide reductase